VNDTVKITDGPLMEMEGNILYVGRNKVKIYLQSLGYILVAEVDKSKVQVIKKNLLPQCKAS
jgi:transcription antitermination factor NusG